MKLKSLAISVLMIAGVASAAGATTLYSTGNDGSSLFTIDSNTGAGAYVGNFGYSYTYSLAFSSNNTLYAVVDSYNSSTLATVNLSTGAATLVGSGTNIPELMALAFSPNGTLYGASWGTDDLYTINPGTGVASIVGSLGFGGIMDLAFDSSGQLYGVSQGLYKINTTTGAGTQVDAGAGDGCLMALTISGGNFLTTDYCSGSSPLYKLNPADGSVTAIGDTGISRPMALTYEGVASSVPEPAAWGLMILGLFGVGAVLRRRGAPVLRPLTSAKSVA